MGCSPRGRKESDTTEQLHFHFFMSYFSPPRSVVVFAYLDLSLMLLIGSCAGLSGVEKSLVAVVSFFPGR